MKILVQENDDIGDDFADEDIDLDDESIEDSDDSDEKPKRGRQKKTAQSFYLKPSPICEGFF